MEDPQLCDVLRYVLLRRVWQLFDSGGESQRSMRSQLLEAVVFNTPVSVRQHPQYQRLVGLLEEDPHRFQRLANDVLRMAKVAGRAVVFPEMPEDRADTEQLGQQALAELLDWNC